MAENFLEELNFDKGNNDNGNKSVLDQLNDDKDDKDNDKDDDDKELSLTNDILSDDKVDDDEDEEEDDDKQNEEDEDEEDEKDDEEEIDLEEEDDLELAKIPKRQEIKAKYPKIFKEFPALDHIIGRERAYSEAFSTVKEAKEAKERLGEFAAFEADLLSGKLEPILRSVKKTDEKAYDRIVNTYVETLASIDPAANLKISTKILRATLKHFDNVTKGKEDDNSKQLAIAAKLINNAVFGTFEITGPEVSQIEEKENPKEKELNDKTAKFEQDRFTAAFTEVSTSINTLFERAVGKELDAKGELPGYLKKTITKDVLETLNKQLNTDNRFKQIINRLWIQAKDNNYSTESKNKILTALRNKAKTELLPIIRSKRAEATKGLSLGERNGDKKKINSNQNKGSQDRRENRERPNNENSEELTNSRRSGGRLEMKQGESISDFFMRD